MSNEIVGTPDALDGQDGKPFVSCHRSWVVGFQEREVPPRMQGGKIVGQGGVAMVPVPGMMPCLASQCMMWDDQRKQCIERTAAETAIGHQVPRATATADEPADEPAPAATD